MIMVKSIQNQTVNQFHGFGENNKTVTIDQMYSSYNRYACCYYTDVKDIKKDCWKDLQLDFNYRKYYVRCVFNESARIVKPDYSLVPYCPNMEQQRVLQPVAKMMRHSHGKTTFLASNRSWSQVCKI